MLNDLKSPELSLFLSNSDTGIIIFGTDSIHKKNLLHTYFYIRNSQPKKGNHLICYHYYP